MTSSSRVSGLGEAGARPRAAVGRPRGVLTHGDAIRRAREARYYTQCDLAELAATTTKSIQRAERGGPVSVGVLREIGRALGLPLSAVLGQSPEVAREELRARGLSRPASREPWVGREEVEVRLASRLASRGDEACLVALGGPPGIGKSRLAERIAARVEAAFDDGVLWIDGEGLADRERCFKLQQVIAGAFGMGLPAEAGASTDRAFRAQLARRDVLVVVDGATPETRLDAFIGDEPGLVSLVTTRFRHVAEAVDGQATELGPLATEMAMALFEELIDHARIEADTAGAKALMALLGGVPRGIVAAAAVLRRERLTRPGMLARRLREEAGAPWWAAHVAVMTSRSELSRSALQVLETMGALVARGVASAVPSSIVIAASGLELDEAGRALGDLVDRYLVWTIEPGVVGGEPWLALSPMET